MNFKSRIIKLEIEWRGIPESKFRKYLSLGEIQIIYGLEITFSKMFY